MWASSTAVLLLLALTTISALVIHGYHLGTDDAEIYQPAIKKAVNAHLFPFGDEFFMHHAHLSLFPRLIAWSSSLRNRHHCPFCGLANSLWKQVILMASSISFPVMARHSKG